MRLKFATAAIAALTAVATLAYAQTDVIKTRQAFMQANQDALDKMFAMADGSVSFDAAAVQPALDKFAAGYATLPSLFPGGSNAGDTAALPAVWSNNQAFVAMATKLSNDAKIAAAALTSRDALNGPELAAVARDCTNCHTQFRRIGPPGGGFKPGFGGPFPGGPPPRRP